MTETNVINKKYGYAITVEVNGLSITAGPAWIRYPGSTQPYELPQYFGEINQDGTYRIDLIEENDNFHLRLSSDIDAEYLAPAIGNVAILECKNGVLELTHKINSTPSPGPELYTLTDRISFVNPKLTGEIINEINNREITSIAQKCLQRYRKNQIDISQGIDYDLQLELLVRVAQSLGLVNGDLPLKEKV